MEMTKRDRLIAALNRQQTDRVPWAPLIDDYFIRSLRDGGRQDAEIITVMREIGCDIMERHVPCVQTVTDNVEIKYSANETDTKHQAFYTTPVGNLDCEWTYTGNSWVLSRHLIRSVEDMKVFQYVAEHTRFEADSAQFNDRDKYIGEDGIPTASGPMSPILELLQMLCGVEQTVYLGLDYPDETEELKNALQERNIRHYKALADSPALAVFDYEDTSTTFMSRDMLTDDSMPAFNAYADILHDAGKIFVTHMCGCLDGFKHEIAQGRQDGVDSICPPGTGDLCIWDARAAFGDKLVIGGICPPDLAMLSTEENITLVKEILQKMQGQRGFILSTGDATPYGANMETLKAITKLVRSS